MLDARESASKIYHRVKTAGKEYDSELAICHSEARTHGCDTHTQLG